jgi:RimJ/RimL family protein N-acetyltransferase
VIVDENQIRLRPVRAEDAALYERFYSTPDDLGEFNWLGFRSMVASRQRLEENGFLTPEGGHLVVVLPDDTAVRFVSWYEARYGTNSHAWGIGISLVPDKRGRGIGTLAQRQISEYLFATTPVNRVEADTEVDNVAERRSLTKAGFIEEGILRGGRWRDVVMFSRLRSDNPDKDG